MEIKKVKFRNYNLLTKKIRNFSGNLGSRQEKEEIVEATNANEMCELRKMREVEEIKYEKIQGSSVYQRTEGNSRNQVKQVN